MSDRAIVQRAAARMKRSSLGPKLRIVGSAPSARQESSLDHGENGREGEGHHEVYAGDDEIDLEAPEASRLDVVGGGGQLVGGDRRADARIQHDEDELAGERRID